MSFAGGGRQGYPEVRSSQSGQMRIRLSRGMLCLWNMSGLGLSGEPFFSDDEVKSGEVMSRKGTGWQDKPECLLHSLRKGDEVKERGTKTSTRKGEKQGSTRTVIQAP